MSPLPRSRSSSARVRSSRIAADEPARSRRSSSSVESANGDSRARSRISFACARPMPASARWSRSSGCSRRDSRPRISASAAGVDVERVRPEVRELRLERVGREQPDAGALLLARLGEDELAAVREAEPERRRLRALRRRARGSAAGPRSSGGRAGRARRRRWGRAGSCRAARAPAKPASLELRQRRVERLQRGDVRRARLARPGTRRHGGSSSRTHASTSGSSGTCSQRRCRAGASGGQSPGRPAVGDSPDSGGRADP